MEPTGKKKVNKKERKRGGGGRMADISKAEGEQEDGAS